jgi:hypothetical protein
MSTRAVRLCSVLCLQRVAAQQIYAPSDGLKMIWVAANAVLAEVVNVQSNWN